MLLGFDIFFKCQELIGINYKKFKCDKQILKSLLRSKIVEET